MTTDPRVHALRLREFGIPRRLRHLRLHTLADSAYHSECQQWLDNLRDHYVTDKRPLDEYPEDWSQIGKGIMLSGPPGTGKTTLATAVLLEVYYAKRLPVYWISYADYVKATLRQRDLQDKHEPEAVHEWWEIQDKLARVLHAPVVLLDDVGKEHRTKTGYAEGELDTLLRERHREARPTLITSNLRRDDWGTIYNPSMGSFVNEAFLRLGAAGDDRRVRS